MISELKLKEICSKYNINYEKLLNTNENILEYGDYNNICDILEYLINEIRIQSKNIEKCPSILCFSDLKNIKYNWEYLKEQEINTSNVMNCLHILSTEFKELKRTYQYVDYNYGKRYLNENTSILKVNIDRIQEIENNFKNFDKKQIIQASISDLDITEIEKIVKVCKEYGIEITGSVFRQSEEEIKKIVKVCKENGIEITGSVFLKTAEEIEKIVKVCKENGIEITGSVFFKTAEEIKKIVKVCKENGIEITGSVFSKPAEEIEKIVKVCKANGIEITGSVFKQSAEEIEKIVKVCKENGIEITGSVFFKTAEEIEKIVKVCKENGIEITGSVFLKTAEEIEKIVKVCKENGIEITGSVFLKKAEQLEENINYIKQNYGTEYVLPLIISKNNKTLKKVLPYLKEKGVLKNVKKSSSILSLSLSEIKERVEFIEKIGEEFVNSKGMFNSILGLSRKRYMIKKEEYEKNNSEKLKSEDMLKAIEGVTVEQLDKAEAVIQNLVEEQEKDNNPSLSED